ncbi:MAG TPA: VOC family protein, partial [Ktedonobacterales bacterium]
MTDLPESSGAGLPAHLIKRIDHVAIVVRSIDQALGFYRDVLGLQPSAIKALPAEGVRIAFLPSGGPGGSEIELVEPTDPTTGVEQFLEKRGEGLHHICLETPDIDAALAYLTAQGARVID